MKLGFYLSNDIIGVSCVYGAGSLEPAAFNPEIAPILFRIFSHEHFQLRLELNHR